MKSDNYPTTPIVVGISACLLGEKVRFDAGHKHDRYITDILGVYFEFLPICPEISVGMGVPRESVRLKGAPEGPSMLGVKSRRDWTGKMNTYARQTSAFLEKKNLCGYIFKKDSPSCGLFRVKIYSDSGMPSKNGRGLYARAITDKFPLLPVEEEGRLNDLSLRENFITRVFAYHRLQHLFGKNYSRQKLVRFHTIHKYLMLAHSPKHYKSLGQLVAEVKKHSPAQMKREYSTLFMEGLGFKTTTSKNVNVLQHIMGFLKKHLSDTEKKDIFRVIEDYRRQLVPLVVPLTLVKHYIDKHGIEYIQDQIYLNPHPKELMLRNHV